MYSKSVLVVGEPQLLSKVSFREAFQYGLLLDRASSYTEALAMARHSKRPYNLVVLDARQDPQAALQFCRKLQQRGLNVACFGLSEEVQACCANPIPATIDLLAGIRGVLASA